MFVIDWDGLSGRVLHGGRRRRGWWMVDDGWWTVDRALFHAHRDVSFFLWLFGARSLSISFSLPLSVLVVLGVLSIFSHLVESLKNLEL
jgi:hypothetical protein